MASESGVRTTLRTLREANSSPDSKAWALTSLRRSHLENQKVIKTLSDEEFCELCNSIIELGIRESVSDKLHTEACRTLDTILPESQNKKFDFFQSILQINRKKRLKILVSLSILKDETVAIVASKLSIIEFFNDCLVSVQPKTMIWLQPEFVDNAELIKTIDTRVLNETEEFEEKVIERSLQLLHRLCELSSVGLSVQQFDTFIMDKIVLLSYMGTSKQRTAALAILHSAAKNDLGTRVRSFHKDIWDKYKLTLQNIYCKRMTLLVNLANPDWSRQWETSIILIGTDLHRGSALVNSLLKVEELAFKSADPIRRQAFLSWKLLIDNFALDPRELATARRIKLLCVPLNAKNSKNELMILTKMEVWWHLIHKVYSSITECIDSVLIPYLTLCFGPLGDQPLFSQNKDSSVVALGKRFLQTQIFSIGTFTQLIVSEDDRSNISISIDLETLPHPVSNSVFEKVYKIFIHCFGESIITLGSLSKDSIKNKSDICKIMWINLINRIEEYDKMKVPMYKEVLNVISELIKNQFHEIPLIKDFLLNVVLKSFNKIVKSVPVPESILLDLTFAILHVNNFSCMTNDHNQHIESLLWHVIKPSSADVYYPETLELMQKILKIIDEASKTNSYMSQACEIWCILAKIAKKYIADYQNINEGNLIKYNFKTIESIINFPFTNLVTNDFTQIKNMTEIWCSLYKQFDFQAELIVTVKPHEILERVSKTIIASLHNDKMCCDFAAVCIDGLLDVVNYDNLPSDKEVPQFVHLLKNLTIQCIESKSYATDKSLKALSSFLLCVFSHSPEKTILYLKVVEPAIKCMITKLNDNSLERDLLNMWTTIVGLFKKLKKSLTYDLLNCYSQTIALAAKNRETCAATYSILDVKDNVDEKSKKLLESLSKEFDQSSILNDSGIIEPKEKLKKRAHTPIGSFLNRKSPSTSVTLVQNGKENVGKASKIVNVEPDSQDFVVINTDIKLDVNRLTEHQKERLKKRRDDIPAMYNELSVSNSQDSQQLQHWFNVKSSKSPQKKGAALNKSESAKKSDPQLSAHKIICETQEEQATTSSQSESEKPITSSSGSAGKLSPKVAAPAAAAEQENNRAINAALAKDAAATAAADDVAEQAPNVAKRLNFEAEPAESEPEEETQRSPSLESGTKMRRKSNAEEQDKPGVAQQKGAQSTRRSLQQQPGRERLRKFNSAEQLVKSRGRKRRNSDNNSESMLRIERVKRPRFTDSMEVLNSCDSEKSSEDGDTQNPAGQVEPTKNLSKRQLSEITRLKINMRFEPLPNRRSVCKSGDAEKKPAGSRDERSKEEKTSSSAGKAKEDRVVSPSKRESRNVASAHKLADANSQSFQSVISTRRSLKGFGSSRAEANEQKQQETGALGRKEAAARRSVAPADNAGLAGKSTARKSLPGKFESNSFKKKLDSHTQESTQEAVDIEDVTTQADNNDKLEKNNDKRSESQDDDATMMEEKASQDPDIVESSQEPSLKFDKAECFIKIKKVELFQNSSFLQQVPEKVEKSNAHDKIIEETQMDTEDKSVSVIQATIESERPVQAQTETKKGENKVTGNQNLSPKSSHPRAFKPKTFSLSGRAAQMIGLVTKQSMTEKFGNSESTKVDFNLTDEVTIVPLKKDKVVKESDRVASPISSRQEKMFNNMNNLNNLKQQDRCSSPAIMMFCNLKNDGERISPKLERHQLEKESEKEEKESSSTEMSDASDDSPKKKELPMLEWSNANPPSLTASPSVSILKRMQEFEFETPNSRKKRVSFADPPVSREMGYVIMTETSSPPRLEKLPTVRSPTSRKDSRKDLRKDLRIQRRRIERENDLNSGDDKLTNNEIGDETSISNEVSVSLSPKVRLSTILTKVPEEPKTTETEPTPVSQTQDMFEDTSVSTNETVPVKTSTQNDANNSSIKIDSFNLSNILQRSDKNQSLEDTVDINNLSSSLENTHNTSDKTSSTCSTCSTSCKEPADTLPVTDSVFSNPALTQESQNNVAQLSKPEILDSTLPIYPSLTSCSDAIDSIRAELVEPTFAESLAKHFSLKSIRSVGDLAQLTEREISRLPIVGVCQQKVETVKKALSRYEKNLARRTPKKKMKPSSGVSSSTPLGNRRRDKNKLENELFNEFESESVNNSYENKRRFSKRSLADTSMQTSPIKRLKKDDEKTFAELMTQCDEDFVMNQFVKKFNFDKVLQSYNMQSSELLKILVKNLIQEKEKKSNLQIFNEADLQILLNEVPANSILEQIKIRKDLNSSEAILNICLENGVNKLSNDAKRKTLKNFAEKIDTSDLFDVCVEILETLKLKTC